MKKFALVIGLLASVSSFAGVIYSNTADLRDSTSQHRLADAEYKLIPTKIEVREIPNCNPYGEDSRVCTETVVLESQPVIAANVSYVDTMGSYEGQEKSWLTLNLKAEDFSAEDVAALKAASPTWRHPFSRARTNFARKNLALKVERVQRTIQVVDVRNSRLCNMGESGEPTPGCVEHIVYKTTKTTVKEVTVSKK